MPTPTPSSITPEWLSALLPNADVRSVEAERLSADRGFTGDVFGVRAMTAEGERHFVVKLPRPDQWERSLREIRFLESVKLPIHAPRLLSSDSDPSTKESVLVLTRVCGDDGDAVAGTTPERMTGLVRDLAHLHASFRTPEALEKLEWLPQWGRGTEGASRPHKRRVERFHTRAATFLTEHASVVPTWAGDLLDHIGRHLERTLETLSELPLTLIHGDAHLDNIVFKKETAHWLDWQSASRGPGLYDLTRLLSENTDPTSGIPAARQLVHAYGSHMQSHGVDKETVGAEIALLPEMAIAVLAGFVSGYGGSGRDGFSPRERLLVDRAVSDHGLFGLVRHLAG